MLKPHDPRLGRVLIVAADRFSESRLAAIAAGTEPRIEVMEMARRWGADLLSFDGFRAGGEGPAVGGGEQGGLKAALTLGAEAARRAPDYDCVLAMGEEVAAAMALRRWSGPALVVIGHYLSRLKKRPFVDRRFLGRRIDRLVTYSPLQRRFAIERLGFSEARVALIDFHADTGFYRPSDEERDPELVVAAGFEHRDYGALFDAVSDGAYHLELGVGSPWSRFRRRLPSLPPRAHNRYRSREELRALYRKAGAVVLPLVPTSFQAGISVLLEAWACGAPVIVSDTPGLRHVPRQGADALLVPARDPGAIRQALDRLRVAPELRARLSEAARRRALAVDTDRFVDELAAILAGARGVAACR